MPREFGVPKHPLFFLKPLMKSREQRKADEKTALLADGQNFEPRTFNDNQDVANEKQKVFFINVYDFFVNICIDY